jgi:hypothetical protein
MTSSDLRLHLHKIAYPEPTFRLTQSYEP